MSAKSNTPHKQKTHKHTARKNHAMSPEKRRSEWLSVAQNLQNIFPNLIHVEDNMNLKQMIDKSVENTLTKVESTAASMPEWGSYKDAFVADVKSCLKYCYSRRNYARLFYILYAVKNHERELLTNLVHTKKFVKNQGWIPCDAFLSNSRPVVYVLTDMIDREIFRHRKDYDTLLLANNTFATACKSMKDTLLQYVIHFKKNPI